MKIKLLASSIVCTMFLTACGGSGGSSSGSVNNSSENKESPEVQEFVWYETYISSNGDYQSWKTEIKGDTTINRSEYLDKGADGNLEFIDNTNQFDFSNEIYLTKDSMYRYSTFTSQDGVSDGSKIKILGNQWVVEPPLVAGKGGLTFTSKYNTINISNKSLAEVAFPFEYSVMGANLAADKVDEDGYIDPSVTIFINELKDKKFPTGSKCLQEVENSNNQDLLYLWSENISLEHQSTLADQWNEMYDLYNQKPKDPNVTLSEYFNSILLKNSITFNQVIKLNSQEKATYHYGFEELQEESIFILQNEIEEERKELVEGKTTLSEVDNLYLESLQKECSMYNKTANDFIKAEILKYAQKYRSKLN